MPALTRIRVIAHYPDGIPDVGSFEVWFADGRPSEYFDWTTIAVGPRSPARWISIEQRKPLAPLREPSAPSWKGPLRRCLVLGGIVYAA